MTTDANWPLRFSGRQRLMLFVLLGAGFMLSADFSVLNVALPDVGRSVGLGLTGLPWITAGYALPAAGFSLMFGRLADLFGRRRLFLSGVVLLIGASLVGGFAASTAMLLTARVLQGFATAMAAPAALSLLTSSFPEGPVRDRVLGLNGALLSGGFTVGALVGGTLVSLLSWRAAFFINVPVAAAILLLTPTVISETRSRGRVKLDLPGAATVSGGLLALIYAVIDKNIYSAAAGVVLLAAFWMIELRSPAPLAPVGILRQPTVMWGNCAGLVVLAMETGMIFLMTLYLQRVLRFSPLATGLIFGVPGLASVAAGLAAGRFIGRFGSRAVLAAGMSVQGMATLPLVFLGASRTSLAVLIPALLAGFFGHVTSIVAYTVTGTSGLPDRQQGLATGLTSMSMQVGATVGIPVLSAIAATQSAELTGIHLALAVDVAVTLVSMIFIWFALRPRAEPRTPAESSQEEATSDRTEREGDHDGPGEGRHRRYPAMPGTAYLHSRDITYAVFCQGPYGESIRYRGFMGWDMPWYSAQDPAATLLAPPKRNGRMHLVCYLRDGGKVFETYWTTLRGVEAMDNSYALMDLTVYGRQESWEDSPAGWPQQCSYTDRRRAARLAPGAGVAGRTPHRPVGATGAGRSDDLGTA